MKTLLLAVVGMLMAGVAPCVAQDHEAMLTAEGERLFEAKKYPEAEKTFKALLRIRPKNAFGHYYLARIYVEPGALQDSVKARSHYAKAKQYKIEFKGKIEPIPALDIEGPPPVSAAPENPPGAPQEPPPPQTATEVQPSPIPAEAPGPPPRTEPAVQTPVRVPEFPPPVEEPVAEDARQEEEIQDSVAVAKAALPDMEGTPLGEMLEKENRGEPLDYSERYRLQVFREGSKMAQRKIDRRLFDDAEKFAWAVTQVAQDSWYGHYLMTRIYLAKDDNISAKAEWKKVKSSKSKFVPSTDWPNLEEYIITDPKELLDRYLEYAREMMDRRTWIDAEQMLTKTQDIEDLPSSPSVMTAFAEVDFRLGVIAYRLKDYEKAIEDMEAGIAQGYNPPRRDRQLIEQAKADKGREDNMPLDPTPLAVQPMHFTGLARGYGSVRLNLQKDYFDSVARTNLGGQRSEPTTQVTNQANTYEIQGGRIYNIDFDRRRQLRRAVLQAASSLTLIGLFLLL